MTCQTPDIVWMEGSGKRHATALLPASIAVAHAVYVLTSTHFEFLVSTQLHDGGNESPRACACRQGLPLRGMLQRALANARHEIRATDDGQPQVPMHPGL